MEKISAVYKIVNTVTNDCYVGSSKNVMQRWASHKRSSYQKQHPNSPLYNDMQKYGVDKFRFQILTPVMPEYLKQVEQEFIDLLQPTYNKQRANDIDVERQREVNKEAHKKYCQSEKGKEAQRKAQKKYENQLCFYNGETVILATLAARFRKAGIEHPKIEAKKFLLDNNN